MELTTKNYWNCDCKENYIQPKLLESCIFCNAERDEHHPDSHVTEVLEKLDKEAHNLDQLIQEKQSELFLKEEEITRLKQGFRKIIGKKK